MDTKTERRPSNDVNLASITCGQGLKGSGKHAGDLKWTDSLA